VVIALKTGEKEKRDKDAAVRKKEKKNLERKGVFRMFWK